MLYYGMYATVWYDMRYAMLCQVTCNTMRRARLYHGGMMIRMTAATADADVLWRPKAFYRKFRKTYPHIYKTTLFFPANIETQNSKNAHNTAFQNKRFAL